MSQKPAPMYVFLDEGGDLNFSRSGSRYFTLTSVATFRPFQWTEQMNDLRFDLIEQGLDIEYFHASHDRHPIREKVFAIIEKSMNQFRADSVIVEKCKTGPSLREDEEFYPRMLGYLLRYLINGVDLKLISEVIVITDRLPVQRKRNAIEKSIKMTLASMLPQGTKYRLMHHESRSCAGLQVADYFNWAIFRKWEIGDDTAFNPIRSAIRSQFDIFRTGAMVWYHR